MPAAEAIQPSSNIDYEVESFDELLQCLRSVYRIPGLSEPLSVEEDERRRSVRIDYETPVRITPVVIEAGQLRPLEHSIPGTTCNVSLQGVSLTHSERLMDFYAAITFDLPLAEKLSLLVELQWTFQEANDCYRSGARFVGLLRAG